MVCYGLIWLEGSKFHYSHWLCIVCQSAMVGIDLPLQSLTQYSMSVSQVGIELLGQLKTLFIKGKVKVFVISNSTIYSEEFVSHVTGSMLWNHTKNDSILQLTKIGHKTKGKHRHQWPERSFSEQVKFSPNFTQFWVKLLTQIAARVKSRENLGVKSEQLAFASVAWTQTEGSI